MRILNLYAYYSPEIAASSYIVENIQQACAREGFEMVLYTPEPTRGISTKVRKEYKKKKHEIKYEGKLKIYRFAMFREGKNPIGRAFRYFCCNVAQLINGVFAKDINLICIDSTPPTQGALAAILKKIKKVPVVYTLQDIFPDSLVNTGLASQGSFLWKVGRIIENFTYRNMDKIIVISDDFKQNIISKGVPTEKVEVIYNWVDEKAVVPIDRKNNELFDKLQLDRDKFYVVYAGNLGQAQNIEIILKAAQSLSGYSDIRFVIFGGGQHENYYKEMVKDMQLLNIYIFPLQPYSLASNVYSLGDVSLVSCKKGLGKSAMPSKTWSIMSAETAVIANFDEGTDLQHIIEDNNVGIFTIAEDVEGLKNAILKMYNDKDLCRAMGENGRKFILNNLTREIGTQKYIEVIKSIVRI